MKKVGNNHPKDHQMTVALRIRPFNRTEAKSSARCIVHQLGPQTVLLQDPGEDPADVLRCCRTRERTFTFNEVFDQAAAQEHVYQTTMKNLVDDIISGYSAAIFAYGPTGTGKTFTMMGNGHEPGVIFRALKDLYKTIEVQRGQNKCSVSVSYAEVYNETVRDLLRPSSGCLTLREYPNGNTRIEGIAEFFPSSPEEAIALLTKGNKRRSKAATAANKSSSRSHAVVQVTVKQTSNDGVRTGRLYMVDLAGSERACQTKNTGQTLKESGYINRSLLALRNCITALRKRPGSHINYRDSKLTWLLKGALSGRSRMVMITHISPADAAYEDSRSTLTYGSKAKHIKTLVERNRVCATHKIPEATREDKVQLKDPRPPEPAHKDHKDKAPSSTNTGPMRRSEASLHKLPPVVSMPRKHLAVPEAVVPMPRTHLAIPEAMVPMPRTHLAIPEAVVPMPGKHLAVPEAMVPISGKHLAVPEAVVSMPGKHLAVPEAVVPISGKHLAVPEAMVSMPGKHLAVPEAVVPMPREQLAVPEPVVPMPGEHLAVPEAVVPIPREQLAVPEAVVPVPRKHLAVPEALVPMPRKHLAVPEAVVPMPRKHLAVPDAVVSMPKKHLAIPEVMAHHLSLAHKVPEGATKINVQLRLVRQVERNRVCAPNKIPEATREDKVQLKDPRPPEPAHKDKAPSSTNTGPMRCSAAFLHKLPPVAPMPRNHLAVPEAVVSMPRKHLAVPEAVVPMAKKHLAVPEAVVHMPRKHLAIPEPMVSMPKKHLAIPEVERNRVCAPNKIPEATREDKVQLKDPRPPELAHKDKAPSSTNTGPMRCSAAFLHKLPPVAPMPRNHLAVPEAVVSMPRKHLAVPEAVVPMAKKHLAVPEAVVRMPRKHLAIPEPVVSMPKKHLAIPEVKAHHLSLAHKIPEGATKINVQLRLVPQVERNRVCAPNKIPGATREDKVQLKDPRPPEPAHKDKAPSSSNTGPMIRSAAFLHKLPPVVHMPRKHLAVPDPVVPMPRKHLAVPDPVVPMPRKHLAIPEPAVSKPRKHLAIPEPVVSKQRKHLAIPEVMAHHLSLAHKIPEGARATNVQLRLVLQDWTGRTTGSVPGTLFM